MSKLLIIKISAVVLICVIVFYQFKKIQNQNVNISRLENNWNQQIVKNSTIVNLLLSEQEQSGQLTRSKDSLSKLLQIKPRQIQKIVYITINETDTIKVNVPVYHINKNEWILRDSGSCFKYVSNLKLSGDSLKAIRQLFEYNNKTTEVFYKKRPYKFLFIKYGRWRYLQSLTSECGSAQEKNIQFIK